MGEGQMKFIFNFSALFLFKVKLINVNVMSINQGKPEVLILPISNAFAIYYVSSYVSSVSFFFVN